MISWFTRQRLERESSRLYPVDATQLRAAQKPLKLMAG